MTRQMLRLMGAAFTLDIGKAQRELGYRPVVSRESGLMAMQAI
jgi:nucleoside-diphosphate-sugar epimerase